MTNRLRELADRLATEAYGGPIPAEVLELAQLAELYSTRILRELPIDPNKLYMIRNDVAEMIIKIISQALYIERTGQYTEDWDNGFGTISSFNTHTNGETK